MFIIGPSHHYYFERCALTQCTQYETPLGDLDIDLDTIAELHKSGMFDRIQHDDDEAEHSIEMHLPFVYKLLTRTFSDYVEHLPPIIPILVGNTSPQMEMQYGELLSPYLADPQSIFVVSSDFCHWGLRFRYTYYEPSSGPAGSLKKGDRTPTNPPVHESIGAVDLRTISAVETGDHGQFITNLQETGNTVCGRHPIGIVMSALAVLRARGISSGMSATEIEKSKFKFIRYERSSDAVDVKDSSVSYASAFAVV